MHSVQLAYICKFVYYPAYLILNRSNFFSSQISKYFFARSLTVCILPYPVYCFIRTPMRRSEKIYFLTSYIFISRSPVAPNYSKSKNFNIFIFYTLLLANADVKICKRNRNNSHCPFISEKHVYYENKCIGI